MIRITYATAAGLLYLLFLFASCSNSENSNTVTREERAPEEETPSAPVTPADTPRNTAPENDWTLVFEDEFNSNLDQWNIWLGGAFNNEIQLYNESQLNVANGILTITAQKNTVTGATSPFNNTPKSFDYVSGRIESKLQFGPSSGEGETEYRFMSRLKLPQGTGMWPAFWSYADPWPTQGEIDILEARGNRRTEFQSNIFFGNAPNVPLNKNEDTSVVHRLSTDITNDFHTYELIWKANSLDILFDGSKIHTYVADSKNFVAELFGKKQQIVLNLAVGGEFFNGVAPSQFVNSSTMQVDWVRVYKR